MEITEESAFQYSERLGLFHSHRKGRFSPHNCLASLPSFPGHSPAEALGGESLGEDIDFPIDSVGFERESLVGGRQDELRCTMQTRSPSSYQPSSVQDLLVEPPDMGPDSSTDFNTSSNIILDSSTNFLMKQYLPLISLDHKDDQGLNFPPHVDRLHQALLYMVDHERLLASTLPKNTYEDEFQTTSRVFCSSDAEITPPQSPRHFSSLLCDASNALAVIGETSLGGTEPSQSEAKTFKASNMWDSNVIGRQALHREPEEVADENRISEAETPALIAATGAEDVSHGLPNRVLEATGHGDPSNSFFDDAFVVGSDHDQDEHIEMRNIASILDKIDRLLLPLPNISAFDLDHCIAEKSATLGTLGLESHKRLPPLRVDPALEEALPWAPLPPRRRGQFEVETLTASNKYTTRDARENGPSRIGAIGTIEDGEIEECSEPQKATKPPPPPNSLDALIKLRLQRGVSEQGSPSSTKASPPPSKAYHPILPGLDDPGATSKLVSAFMSLRGVKAKRSNVK